MKIKVRRRNGKLRRPTRRGKVNMKGREKLDEKVITITIVTIIIENISFMKLSAVGCMRNI